MASRHRISYLEWVHRVDEFLQEHPGEQVTITGLSRMMGVSERTLRVAFRTVLGVSPKQYVIAIRLRDVHRALASADPGTETVTALATTYGFFELGRFAGRYRDVYGQAPSITLHHGLA